MDNTAESRNLLRYNDSTELYIKEDFSEDADTYEDYKVYHLMFLKEYKYIPGDEVISEIYAQNQEVDNVYLKERNYPLIELLTHDMDSFLFMSISSIYDSVEMLSWIIYTPYERGEDRNQVAFYENSQLLFSLLKTRIKIILATENDEDMLDGPPQFITHYTNEEGKKTLTSSMAFVKEISAYMDQLEVDLFAPWDFATQAEIIDIDESTKKRLYNYYFKELTFEFLLEMFIDFRAEQIVTPADKYINQLKYHKLTDKMDGLLFLKNDQVYQRYDKVKKVDELWELQMFVDFMFAYAFEQRFNKKIKYDRNVFLNLYHHQGTWFTTLSGCIFHFYMDDLCKEESSLKIKYSEKEKHLPYLYF